VEEARAWLGTPWRHQGRTKHGIDCAGLVILVGKNLGLINYDTTDYQRRTHSTQFLKHFKAHLTQKPVMDAAPGDVLLFRDSAFPCHSTIVSEKDGELTIIHAHALRRMVVEEWLGSGDWLSRRVACFAYPKLED